MLNMRASRSWGGSCVTQGHRVPTCVGRLSRRCDAHKRGFTLAPHHINLLRISNLPLCSRTVPESLLSREDGNDSERSAQAGGRIVPEGLLSREEGSDSERSAQAGGRFVPEGLLSREDGSDSERSAQAGGRFVPEGLLSREEGSDSERSAQAGGRFAPEGLLSREEGSDSERSAQAGGRFVPEGLLSREDGSDSDRSAQAGGRFVPEGLLSREDGSDSDRSAQAGGRFVPEGLLSREEGSDSERSAQAGGRFVPEGLLSREDGSDSDRSAQAGGRFVPEGLLSREDGSDSDRSAQAGGRFVPEGLLSREEGSDSERSAQAGGRFVPEGLLSREEGSDSERSSQAGGRFVPEGLLSREEGNDSERSAQAGGRFVPEGLLSREEGSDSQGDSCPLQFNWFQQWYPVASLDALDPTRPHAFTLLGQDLVLWRDGTGSWRAFKDACPHRLAPLSEGRIEKDGTLMCAYHAWRFEGSGACTALPYCSPDDPALRSPRSCAVSYPSLQRGGLLWVWGEGGPAAAAAAAAKQPPLPPEVQADGAAAPGVTCLGWSHRDLPYSHSFFVENVVDPAHVPVSHHNIAGNRYKDPKPFQLEITRPPSLEEGFKMFLPSMESTTVKESYTEFVPPGLVRIESANRDGSRTVLALFSTPIRPGWMRLVGQQIMVEAPGAAARGRSLVGWVGGCMPQWVSHVLAPMFLHQDLVFLHHQDREANRQQQQQQQLTTAAAAAGSPGGNGAESGPGAPSAPLLNKYYMPGQADRGVAAWRNWLSTFGGGDVSYAPGTPPLGPPERDRSKLFDTWNTHTRHCSICLTALKRIRAARAVAAAVGLAAAALAFGAAAVASAAAAAAAAAAAGSGTTGVSLSAVLQSASPLLLSWQGLSTVAVGVVAAVVVWLGAKLEQLMHTYHYSHADNH
ncbi:hypothetical protein PLESTB_001661000 [Pleodorina starrii]|uniref:Rieske domain-containing protein n=1 Tax=Pleodorina starrii TaxID=330485 RepID=A0A9W6BZG1_9CHLO|nr:hypothetical protein PLESTM_001924500 [Pleodorina starrii]GLC60710.1 hypothetical protein PLESTB_001661000 [Pleodorina starrii]GLC70313.1 hypothetical protein PLESTF_000958100 [Pleodorina starrii]